ncbi:hypothetical protein E2C01_054874 [Portunus trituberculatus]|uniref:Uncharacterized protein n=1 Tax=Portunus trituberculatus TaxID=210409 RepID=A0A5B7GUG0_PORTR|nr:hypothetical protein [Portunus trituberculatus]
MPWLLSFLSTYDVYSFNNFCQGCSVVDALDVVIPVPFIRRMFDVLCLLSHALQYDVYSESDLSQTAEPLDWVSERCNCRTILGVGPLLSPYVLRE